MAVDNWVKPVSVASVIAISLATLSFEKVAILEKLYDDLATSGAHGWAILGLLFFALYIQWLATGATTRVERLKAAEESLAATNKKLNEMIYQWQNMTTHNIRLNNSSNPANAFKALQWLAKNPKVLQSITDQHSNEITKG